MYLEVGEAILKRGTKPLFYFRYTSPWVLVIAMGGGGKNAAPITAIATMRSINFQRVLLVIVHFVSFVFFVAAGNVYRSFSLLISWLLPGWQGEI